MDDLSRIVQSLAARLGRAVAIDDPQMNLLTHTAHDEHVDEHRIASVMRLRASDEVVAHALSFGLAGAEGPVRVAGLPDLGLLPRVCVPVRCQSLLLGYLWLIDADTSLTDDELAIAAESAAAAGQVLYRERLLGDLRESRERELLRDLLSDDADVRQTAADQLVEEELLPTPATVSVLRVVVDLDNEEVRTTIASTLRRVARRVAPLTALTLTRGGGQGVLLVSSRRQLTSDSLRDIATGVHADLMKALGADDGVRVGIGPVVNELTEAYVSSRRAREALRVAAALPQFGSVAAWAELGIYRLLSQLPLTEFGLDALPDGLRALAEADGDGPLLDTLETWLDEGCDPRATSTRLRIHRTSLYYRLNRIEEITGMALGNGENRLALHLGLKMLRLTRP